MKRKLGEILIERRLVTQGDIDSALSDQSAGEPNRLGDLLVALGKVSPADLARALSTQAGLPFVEIGPVLPEVLACMPLEVAQRLRAVPFKKTATELHVALADPANLAQLQELSGSLGLKLKAHVAAADEVEGMLAQAAGLGGFEAAPSSPRGAPTADELFGSLELDPPPASPSGEFDDLFQGIEGLPPPAQPEVRPPPSSAPAPRGPGEEEDVLAQLAQEEAAEAPATRASVDDGLDALAELTEAVVVGEEVVEGEEVGTALGEEEAAPEASLHAAVTLEDDRPAPMAAAPAAVATKASSAAPTRRMETLTLPDLAIPPEVPPPAPAPITRARPTLSGAASGSTPAGAAPTASALPTARARPAVARGASASAAVAATDQVPGAVEAAAPPAAVTFPAVQKAAKAEKAEKPDKVEKADKADKAEKPEKGERPDKAEKPDQLEKAEKPEKAHKSEKADKPDKSAVRIATPLVPPSAGLGDTGLPDWLKESAAGYVPPVAPPNGDGTWSGELDVVAPSKVARALARALVKKGVLTEAELLELLGKE